MILFQVNILDAAKMSWVKDPFWTTHPFIYQKLMILLKSTFTMCQVPNKEEWDCSATKEGKVINKLMVRKHQWGPRSSD